MFFDQTSLLKGIGREWKELTVFQQIRCRIIQNILYIDYVDVYNNQKGAISDKKYLF